jgi:hypothetical protein
VSNTRLREITAEMCSLLDHQSVLLSSEVKLTDMSEADLGSYIGRNDRLNQLCKELNRLV